MAEDKGCPDGDDDEIVDRKDSIGAIDQCPSTKGEERYDGCPDSDGDGNPENPLDPNNDLCPGKKGEVRYGGCPDGDADRNPENPLDPNNDKCPGESPAALKRPDNDDNGCADYLGLSPKYSLKPGNYFRVVDGRNVLLGIKVLRLSVSQVPQGASVRVSCTRHACKAVTKRVGSKRKRSTSRVCAGRTCARV